MKFQTLIIYITITTLIVLFASSHNRLDTQAEVIEGLIVEIQDMNGLNHRQNIYINELMYPTQYVCREVKDCEWADWRFTNPEDVCTYENNDYHYIPEVNEAMGEYCFELNYE